MGKFVLSFAVVVAAIVAAAGLFLVIAGPARTWQMIAGNPDLGWFDRSAPARSERPNDALMCTPGLCDGVKVDRELPDYSDTPENLIGRIDEAMRAVAPYIRRVDDGGDPARARYITRTPLMRFPDTNSFEAVALENGQTGLVAYARAQLGYSDGGNNRKRLDAVIDRLDR
ncbi:MAG: hypothetical protein CL535_17605 [Ahrensia sp.]|nr:hypothetical protein [Ahrensia sp.]|tara:strand:+ start:11342 stop:11854 length:513 start_codon:yes stop_codon:yes gene_type:complete